MKLCVPSAHLTTHKHSHTHEALTNPYRVLYCITCVYAFTHHVKFRLKMSTWLSLNRMCLSVCCPAQNITVQSEHHITFWHDLGICAAQSDRKSVEAFANREQVSTSGESSAYHTHYFQHRRYRLLYILYSHTKPVAHLWLPSDIAVDPLLSTPHLVTVANLDKLYRIFHWHKLEISVNHTIFCKMCLESGIY